MPITFRCGCNTRLRAPDEASGKNTNCPSCGASVTIPGSPESEFVSIEVVPEPQPKDMTLEIKLGTLTSSLGAKMSFDLKIDGNGRAHIQAYAYDSNDLRKSGVLFQIGDAGLADLKGIVAKAEQTLHDLGRSGRYRKMLH